MFFADIFPTRLAVCATVLLLGGTSISAFAIDTATFAERDLIAQGAQITHHRLTGQANFIGTRAGNAIALPGTGTPKSASATAMDALNAYGKMFGLRNPASELKQKSLKNTADGRSVIRYQQNYNGIPVIGGEMIVNLSSNNGLLSINGEVVSNKLALPTRATVTAQLASDTALTAVAKWHETTTSALSAATPVLSVYDPKLLGPKSAPASLVWRVEVSSREMKPIRELVLIDALNGHISLHFNQIDTVGMVRETYDMLESAPPTKALPGDLVCNESDPTCSVGDSDQINAHQFAKDTYDFYSTNHGRDSIDGAGMKIISSTHWNDGSSCPNAYWDGSQMVYCTGMVVDDVVAHELTHGVTENESNLFYYFQSGAINESLSDVWGEFVDQTYNNGTGTPKDGISYNWQLGEDINIPGVLVGPIRYMNDPTISTPYSGSSPDKMSSPYYDEDVGFTDNGGVHTNSGINNKAVYLMVDGSSGEAGGTFNGYTVNTLGIPKVAAIYYEVQTNLLTSGADYLDLYNALYQGCQNLIGGSAGITAGDCTQVRAATDAVEMNAEPAINFNPEASVCPSGETLTTTVFFDNFESGLGNWTLTRALGNENWVAWMSSYGSTAGPYAISGNESLFGNDVATTADLRAAITVNVPSGNPYLHFNHAFDFDTTGTNYFDGGILEYSTNGGRIWSDASSLIVDGQAYNGTIITGDGTNPLKGHSAFVGVSHGYVSTRVRLGNFQGKTVQFRWRIGTDSSVTFYGWWLDDVGVYNCTGTAIVDSSSGGGGGGTLGWPLLLLGLFLLPLRRRFRLTV